MPRIFDNIDLPLLPALRDTIDTAERADICVGYFSLRGWKHFAEYVERWPGGDGRCCRLIVGMHVSPGDELRQSLRIRAETDLLDNNTAAKQRRLMAEEFRRQLTFGVPTNADEATLRQLASQIRAGKLVVKLYLTRLHAKLYLMYRKDANRLAKVEELPAAEAAQFLPETSET